MLTQEEKDNLREYLCQKYSGINKLTPEILKEYADKTDTEVREILATDKAGKLARLTEQKATIEQRIAELQ